MNITKRELEDMITNLLFVFKGILERDDANSHLNKSVLWSSLYDKMIKHHSKNKKYKIIIDEMSVLDKFYDEVGLDGFE
tara:strand:- start:331 stop:567 length:237 start_codon:yes stop_codon:yes gene_type:complete